MRKIYADTSTMATFRSQHNKHTLKMADWLMSNGTFNKVSQDIDYHIVTISYT